jgi:hypothetical protein
MKRLLQASFLCLAVFAAGCGGGDSEPLVETVKLKTGQAKTADAGRLGLTMTKFVDSRCPQGVQCVSAGAAVIDVSLSEQGGTPTVLQMTLDASATAARPTYHYGPYRLEFTDLTPYPQGTVLTITDSEATVIVRRD